MNTISDSNLEGTKIPDETEILLRLYEDTSDTALHSESQRSTLTNLIITVSIAVLGLIGHQEFEKTMLPLAIFLILLGIYGIVASMKLYERHQFHRSRARLFRKRIDELCSNAGIINQLINKAVEEHRKRFPKLFGIRLHRLWLLLHLSIVVLGVACLATILFKWLLNT